MTYYYSQHHSLTLIRHYIQNHPTNIYWAHTTYNPIPGAKARTKSKLDKVHTLRNLRTLGAVGGVGLQLLNWLIPRRKSKSDHKYYAVNLHLDVIVRAG